MTRTDIENQNWSAAQLLSSKVEAQDGAVGNLADVLFDDQSWTVRWLIVDSGAWLLSRRVLLPPSSVQSLVEAKVLTVRLDRAQVKASPEVWTDPPVSKQRTADLEAYYSGMGYGLVGAPYAGIVVPPPAFDEPTSRGDAHLRSTNEVIGYDVTEGGTKIGRVQDLQLDLATWDVANLIIERTDESDNTDPTILPERIHKISWESRSVELCVTGDFLKRSSAPLRSLT